LRTIVNCGREARTAYAARVLVVTRFRVPEPEGEAFRADLDRAHAALAGRPGYLAGHVGRNTDDPELWVLVTTWEHVGAYRRALSAYDVKLHAVPTLGRALDEPSAYEAAEPGNPLNVRDSRSLG
jgi:quinol monooxygenase YgiN